MKSKLCMTQELPSSPFHIPSLNGSFILQFFYKNKHWHRIIFFFSTNTLTTVVAPSSGVRRSLCCRKSWYMEFAVVTDKWIDWSKKKQVRKKEYVTDFCVYKPLTSTVLVCASGAGEEGTRWDWPQCVLVAKPVVGLWDISSLRSFVPRIRAKALGMLLGECGSAHGLCDAFIWLTTASLEETGSSCSRDDGSPHGWISPPAPATETQAVGLLLLLKVGDCQV